MKVQSEVCKTYFPTISYFFYRKYPFRIFFPTLSLNIPYSHYPSPPKKNLECLTTDANVFDD